MRARELVTDFYQASLVHQNVDMVVIVNHNPVNLCDACDADWPAYRDCRARRTDVKAVLA
jgi:hypothetical protein